MNRSVMNSIYRVRDLFNPLSVEHDTVYLLAVGQTHNRTPPEFALRDPEMISTCCSGFPP